MAVGTIAKIEGLYGLDNFYYRRSLHEVRLRLGCLYGLDNFYYRR